MIVEQNSHVYVLFGEILEDQFVLGFVYALSFYLFYRYDLCFAGFCFFFV